MPSLPLQSGAITTDAAVGQMLQRLPVELAQKALVEQFQL